MITVGYPLTPRGRQYEALVRGQHNADRCAWYDATKRIERNLLALGFSPGQAWRLAFGEP